MAQEGLHGEANVDELSEYLKLLSHPNRLELLRQLRWPRTIDEIRLTPSQPQAGDNPDRPISRQAVQGHLDQLVAAELVRVSKTDRKAKRAVNEYVVDHAQLFAVTEEFRKLSAIEPLVELEPLRTVGTPGPEERAWEEGPKVVLAHGPQEGRTVALRLKDARAPRGWVIGRAKSAHVCLEYDPFVSLENSEILRVGGEFRLLDLRTSKNGTYLNWERLPVGGEAPLETGDVIGVGRSLLVFREA